MVEKQAGQAYKIKLAPYLSQINSGNWQKLNTEVVITNLPGSHTYSMYQ